MNPLQLLSNREIYIIERPYKSADAVTDYKIKASANTQFNFYNSVIDAFKSGIDDIRNARKEARKQFPQMFSSPAL